MWLLLARVRTYPDTSIVLMKTARGLSLLKQPGDVILSHRGGVLPLGSLYFEAFNVCMYGGGSGAAGAAPIEVVGYVHV